MRGPVAFLLLVVLLGGAVLGCDSIKFRGAINANVVTISGFVTGVRLTNVPGTGGTLIQVTVVTSQQPLGFTTSTFCGNFVSQFPMNTFVQVDFTPGNVCSTIVIIVVTN